MATDPILDTPRTVQELHRHGSIQTVTWRAQRVGWWILALITAAGLAGLLGNGPLAKTSIQRGPVLLQYETILRREADTIATFHMPSSTGRASLTLPASYLDAVEITDIQPEPQTVFAGPAGQTFVFSAPTAATQVRLTVRPRRIGLLDFAPVVNGRPVPARSPVVLP